MDILKEALSMTEASTHMSARQDDGSFIVHMYKAPSKDSLEALGQKPPGPSCVHQQITHDVKLIDCQEYYPWDKTLPEMKKSMIFRVCEIQVELFTIRNLHRLRKVMQVVEDKEPCRKRLTDPGEFEVIDILRNVFASRDAACLLCRVTALWSTMELYSEAALVQELFTVFAQDVLSMLLRLRIDSLEGCKDHLRQSLTTGRIVNMFVQAYGPGIIFGLAARYRWRDLCGLDPDVLKRTINFGLTKCPDLATAYAVLDPFVDKIRGPVGVSAARIISRLRQEFTLVTPFVSILAEDEVEKAEMSHENESDLSEGEHP